MFIIGFLTAEFAEFLYILKNFLTAEHAEGANIYKFLFFSQDFLP